MERDAKEREANSLLANEMTTPETTPCLISLTEVEWTAGCSESPASKAAGESKPEAYPLGYVEDFDEPRTPVADFINRLLI
jgi:hypothetical protein